MHCGRSTISLAAAAGFILTAPLGVAGPWFDGGDLSASRRLNHWAAAFRTRTARLAQPIRSRAFFGANCVRLRIFVEPDGRRFVVDDSSIP